MWMTVHRAVVIHGERDPKPELYLALSVLMFMAAVLCGLWLVRRWRGL